MHAQYREPKSSANGSNLKEDDRALPIQGLLLYGWHISLKTPWISSRKRKSVFVGSFGLVFWLNKKGIENEVTLPPLSQFKKSDLLRFLLELICTNIYKCFNFHSEAPETESFQYHLFFFPNKTFRFLKIILSGDWLTDGSAPLQHKMERLVAEDRRKWPSEHDCSQEETVCGIARFFALHYFSPKNSFLNTFIIQKWDVSPHLRFESRHPAKYCT